MVSTENSRVRQELRETCDQLLEGFVAALTRTDHEPTLQWMTINGLLTDPWVMPGREVRVGGRRG